jgi:hypothetical protein
MRHIWAPLFLLVTCGSATALMVEVPFHQVAQGAEAIVQGTVIDRQSRWTEDGHTIVTDVLIRVNEALKGDLSAGDYVTVLIEGGEVGDVGIWVEHQPRFLEREEVFVFLQRTGDGACQVQQLEQGKFTSVADQVMNYKGEVKSRQEFLAAVRSVLPHRER